MPKVTFFLSAPFLKFVFWNCDPTDFQTKRFKILPIRLLNALCCPFLKLTSLTPLVDIFIIFGLFFMLQSPEEIDVLPIVEPRSFAVSTYTTVLKSDAFWVERNSQKCVTFWHDSVSEILRDNVRGRGLLDQKYNGDDDVRGRQFWNFDKTT